MTELNLTAVNHLQHVAAIATISLLTETSIPLKLQSRGTLLVGIQDSMENKYRTQPEGPLGVESWLGGQMACKDSDSDWPLCDDATTTVVEESSRGRC